MNKILDYVWLSGWEGALNFFLKEHFGIKAHLNLARELNIANCPGIEYMKVEYDDHHPFVKTDIDKCVKFIKFHVDRQEPTLVNCFWGISRSPAMILCYLLEEGYNITEATRLLKSKRPLVNISPIILDSIHYYYGYERIIK